MIFEEKLQMHESNRRLDSSKQVINNQNDWSPSSPWTQFVTRSFANQGGTQEFVPSTQKMDEF